MATRRAVSMRLAGYRQVPAAVIERLKRDIAEVAAPISRSRALPARPGHGGQKFAIAPASVSAAAPEPRADELSEAFFCAGAAERRLILLNLEYVSAALPPAMPPARAIDAIRRLEQAALERNSAQFAGHPAPLAPPLARANAPDRGGPVGRADRGGGEGTQHAHRNSPAHPSVLESGDRTFRVSACSISRVSMARSPRRRRSTWSRSGEERRRRSAGRPTISPCIGTTGRSSRVRPQRRARRPADQAGQRNDIRLRR